MIRFKQIFVEGPRFFFGTMHDFFQLIYGSFKIYKVSSPRITFFGGASLPEKNMYMEKAYLLAKNLAENDISIMTGGGPGIMESANKGASEVGKKMNKIMSLGVNVKDLPGEKEVNRYAQDNLILNNYFMRTSLLINHSDGFIIFPGGYGTIDELATVLTLIQIKKIKKLPVILFGKDFWDPFMDWIYDSALAYGTIDKEEAEFIKITDDVNIACTLLINHCKIPNKTNNNHPT